jgi:hypothetical protein
LSDEREHDLEGRLRDERHDAREEFVRTLAESVRSRRLASRRSRPRVTLAFALSLALLVSLLAFGGAGMASGALHSSTSAVRAAVGERQSSARGQTRPLTPASEQYNEKVPICIPETHYVTTFKLVTIYRWVGHGTHRHLVARTVRIRTRALVTTYREKLVHMTQVPRLISRGAIYPVPSAGCASIRSTTG